MTLASYLAKKMNGLTLTFWITRKIKSLGVEVIIIDNYGQIDLNKILEKNLAWNLTLPKLTNQRS